MMTDGYCMEILVVEAHAGVRERIARVIGECFPGGRVHSVVGGAATLRAVGLINPGVIVMDVRMPEMNGLEVARVLRSRGSRARIVMLARNDLPEYRDAALAAGADLHVPIAAFSKDRIKHLLAPETSACIRTCTKAQSCPTGADWPGGSDTKAIGSSV